MLKQHARRERAKQAPVTLRIKKELAKRLNAFCKENGRVRNVFIENAIEKELEGEAQRMAAEAQKEAEAQKAENSS